MKTLLRKYMKQPHKLLIVSYGLGALCLIFLSNYNVDHSRIKLVGGVLCGVTAFVLFAAAITEVVNIFWRAAYKKSG